MSHTHPQPRLLQQQDDGLLVVQLNHSHRLNSLDAGLLAELGELWTAVREDPRIRAVVLGGTGTEAFCAGMNLGSDGDARDLRSGHALDVPLVVAVNGVVRREGFHLLAGASAIVCAPHVRFVEPPPGSPFDGVPDAAAALSAGLVAEVVPLQQLRGRAESMARSLDAGNLLCSGVAR